MRIPLETLSMSQQPTARRRSKRLAGTLLWPQKLCAQRNRVVMLIRIAAYDEEDGDFVFTRGSKRAKTAQAEPEPAPVPVKVDAPKRGKKKERDYEVVQTVKKGRGRKMSFSTPKADSDAISVPKRRESARSSTGKAQNGESSNHASGVEEDYDRIDMVRLPDVQEMDKSAVDGSKQSTVISLPFSDTPIINRNKELRKKGTGARRSSLGLRGRRASSLIDNGHSAIPHREVETSEFYKHIESAGLSEPRRMKQLLTWTGERSLGDKPSHGDPDSGAELAG